MTQIEPGDKAYWREQIVTVCSIHRHETGDMYVVEDASGVFFRARPESLTKIHTSPEFKERAPINLPGMRQPKRG